MHWQVHQQDDITTVAYIYTDWLNSTQTNIKLAEGKEEEVSLAALRQWVWGGDTAPLAADWRTTLLHLTIDTHNPVSSPPYTQHVD